jgi:glutathione S-transferase
MMMIRLHGFAVSNYYNKVKVALLEKGLPFEEVYNRASKDAATLALSPLGKIPFIETEQGPLSESQVIIEYLEDLQPEPALLPSDPWQRAKIRELVAYLETHVELTARRLYGKAFFGGTATDELIEQTRADLVKVIDAFGKLARFGPYLAGDRFSYADCAGLVHLPLVSLASKTIYGEDLMAAFPVRDYLKLLGERASIQRVNADRKAALAPRS